MYLLTRRVHQRFVDARVAGTPAAVVEDIESIVRSMAAALPTIGVYDQLVGPFYDTAGLTRWRGVSRQAVNKARVTSGRRRIFRRQGRLFENRP